MKDANPSSSSPQSVIQFSPSLQTKRDDGEFSQPKLFFFRQTRKPVVYQRRSLQAEVNL